MNIKAITSLMKKEKVSHSYLLIQQKASKETNSEEQYQTLQPHSTISRLLRLIRMYSNDKKS